MKKYKNYINNEWVGTASYDEVFNPATGQVIAHAAASNALEVDKAVQAARAAFDTGPWRTTTAQARGRILFKMAEVVRKYAKPLAELETRNCGKPIVESEFDMADTATCYEYYGGLATKVHGETLPVPDNALNLTLKEPVGVVALIVPWNYPMLLAAWKLAPALSAGCTVVLKPAEQTPVTMLEFAKLIQKHIPELPPGVLNIVTGNGPEAGRALVESMHVDKIAFTGGTDTGREVLHGVARSNLKKVSLELGGKSPNIFFADCDLDAATDGALFGVFINQGEVCSAGSRILVQEDIYKKFIDRMKEKTKRIKLGDPLKRETKMGPVVTEDHMNRVLGFIEQGRKEAKLIAGGGRPHGLKKGFFIEPTIFESDNHAKIAREEIFGPVVAVIPFKKEEDAVAIANDTPFGLAAAVWSRDIFRCLRVVKNIRAGIVWVNTMQPCYVESPWGGYKQSGQGREMSLHGQEEFLETKQVHINLNEAPIGWY
ncbi:MAG TPA: aldehyde dehydrogenase family protein [Kiritimatiellia bacterium]|nr:aldehyde dehydrogenase family protein [Kiritimatiellia bacterium]HMP33034.1 aldehyde dehydrogenase family protein [Kiritimatiellia bacterium]